MGRRNSVQVFKGGWEELENAVFTTNQFDFMMGGIPSMHMQSDGAAIYVLSNLNVLKLPITIPYDLNTLGIVDSMFSIAEFPTATGISFNLDETEMYVVDSTNKRLYQYHLTTPRILDSIVGTPAVFSGIDLDVSTEDTFPEGITLSTDGFTLFMVGILNDKIYQYDLSTKNDLSTASYSGNFLDVSSEDINPRGLTISSDGFTLFMVGLTNTKIFQYNLSTKNDLSTAVYAGSGNDLDISSEDLNPRGLTISSDGFTLFMAGDANKKIYQYNLSIKNDLSTAVYAGSGNDLNVITEDTVPEGLTISSDGFTLLMVGFTTSKIYQYNLSTKNDLSTAVFSGNFLDISTEDINPRGTTISSDGFTLLMVGLTNKKIYQYNLSTANKLSNVGFSGNSLDISNEATDPIGLTISSDGFTVFMVGTSNDKIYQYNLSIANDISTAVYSGNELDVSTEDTDPSGISITSDGFTVFMVGFTSEKIFQYNLSIANDLSTAVYSGNDLDVSTQDTDPTGTTISSDGFRLFMSGTSNNKIYQYNLPIKNSLSTPVYSGNELDVSTEDPDPEGTTISSDGFTLFMAGLTNRTIYQYNLSVKNDLSTAVYSGNSLDVSNEDLAPLGTTISSDGFTLLMVGLGNRTIYQYNLSIANDLSTAVYSGNSLDVTTEDSFPRGITISSDGFKLFMVGISNDKIHQYNLSIANDISTAVYSGNELNVSTEDPDPEGITISSDGFKLFMIGLANGTIYQYNLSIANDLSTAVYSGNSLDVTTEDFDPTGTTISSDGFKLLMAGTSNDKIYQYNLSTANDISTPSFSGNELDVSTEDTNPRGLIISPDGFTLLMAGLVNKKIFQYNLSTKDNLSTAVYSGNFLDVSSEDNASPGLTISSDGFTLFTTGFFSQKIYQYNLTVKNQLLDAPVFISLSDVINTPLQCTISSNGKNIFITDGNEVFNYPLLVKDDITSNVSNSLFEPFNNADSVAFKHEGDKMYIGDIALNEIVEYQLSSPNFIDDAVPTGNVLDLSLINPTDIGFRSNGKEFFVLDELAETLIVKLHLDDQWDISTASLFTNKLVAADSQGIIWKPDGTKFFSVLQGTPDRIDEFTTLNRWNLTGATITATFSLVGISNFPTGIYVTPDGKTCFITDSGSDLVIQLDMSTGWNLTTMSDPSISLLITSLVGGLNLVSDIEFTKDGLTFYVTDLLTNAVYQLTVPIPLDIVNASYTGNSLSITSNPTAVRIKPDNKLIYILERGGDTVQLYRLPADGNISNAVLLQTLPIGFMEDNPRGIHIRENDGKKIFLSGLSSGELSSMDMSLEFNNSLITKFGDDLVTDLGEDLVYA